MEYVNSGQSQSSCLHYKSCAKLTKVLVVASCLSDTELLINPSNPSHLFKQVAPIKRHRKQKCLPPPRLSLIVAFECQEQTGVDLLEPCLLLR